MPVKNHEKLQYEVSTLVERWFEDMESSKSGLKGV